MKIKERCDNSELIILCSTVRELCAHSEYNKCKDIIYNAMCEYPDSPEPHNLIGIVLEKLGDHGSAMKHFRAAWALDPTYKPVNQNLKLYGTFCSNGKCAFDYSDILEENENKTQIYYDEKCIAHIGHNLNIKYDGNGLGHVVRR